MLKQDVLLRGSLEIAIFQDRRPFEKGKAVKKGGYGVSSLSRAEILGKIKTYLSRQ